MQNDHHKVFEKPTGRLGLYLIIVLILLAVGTAVVAQPGKLVISSLSVPDYHIRDTIRIHDTLRIPIYHYQSSDTIQAAFLLKGDRLISGFIIYSGFKVQTSKGLQWSAEPVASGFLDRKRRVIDRKRIVKAF